MVTYHEMSGQYYSDFQDPVDSHLLRSGTDVTDPNVVMCIPAITFVYIMSVLGCVTAYNCMDLLRELCGNTRSEVGRVIKI
jgi:hypothetical protein